MGTLHERLATWDELASAPRRGLEVLSHTRTHCFMDDVEPQRLADELAGSRADLERHGLGSSSALAWPYGKYDQSAIEAARAAGYRGAFLGEYHWELRGMRDPWRIHRVGVDGSAGLFGFAFALGRGFDCLAWLKRLRRRRRPR
jgi:peptidoglycan/xylan/chitin deacetylase (PgdA/CDA1 family)